MKKAISVLLVLLLCFAVCGCKSAGEAESTGSGNTVIYEAKESSETVSEVQSDEPTISSNTESVSSAPPAPAPTPTPAPTPAPTYSYDETAGDDGIPPFTQEMDNRLLSLDNTRAGYGWKGSENRQGYYSQYDAFATGDRSQSIVYLTFDEGYEYGNNTNLILDILASKNVKAVFFVTMHFAKNNPALISRMINEGHAVGNHSNTHPSFPSITTRKAYDEIKTMHDYILQNYGYKMTLFRFPEGAASDRMLALVKEMGYKTVFWNCAYADWDTSNQPSPDTTRSVIQNNTQNGTIYLLHACSSTNVSMLAEIIDSVRSRGYEFALFG